jgi:hypothetical protein
MKTAELILLAISAVITAAKALIKFIGYICRLKEKKPVAA